MEMEESLIYTHKGKRYRILTHITDREGDRGRGEQLLRDFLHCEEVGDWETVKNRITNGLKWGWLLELTSEENGAQSEEGMSSKEGSGEPQRFW